MNSRQDKFLYCSWHRRKRGSLRATLHLALGLSAAFAGFGLTPFHHTHAQAARCKNPDALGVHREIAVSRKNGFHLGRGKTGGIGLRPGELVLTFDDGPRPGITDPILKALERECVKATFFMLGRAARANPKLTKRVAREGHTIAAHTQSHPFLTRHGNERIAAELRRGWTSLNVALKGTRYKPANFFRYPYLDRSQRTDAVVRKTGMVVFDVHIDSLDWKKTSPEAMRDRLLNRVRQRGSGVILFHDIQAKTAKMLPQILRTLKAEGYKIVHTVPAQRNFKFGKFSALPDIVPAIPRERPERTKLASIEANSPVVAPQPASVNFEGHAPELASPQLEHETPSIVEVKVDAESDNAPSSQTEKAEVSVAEEASPITLSVETISVAEEEKSEGAPTLSENPENKITEVAETGSPDNSEQLPNVSSLVDEAPLTEVVSETDKDVVKAVADQEPLETVEDGQSPKIEIIQSAAQDNEAVKAVTEAGDQDKIIDPEQTQSIIKTEEEVVPNPETPGEPETVVAALTNEETQTIDTTTPIQDEATNVEISETVEGEVTEVAATIPFPKARIGPRVPLPVKRPAFTPRQRTVATADVGNSAPNDALRAVVGSTLLQQDEAETVADDDKERGGFLGIFRPFNRN